MRLLSNSFRVDINSVRINTTNSIEHELAKCKVAYMLIKDGRKIVTEAIFKNGKRADILDLDNFAIYEILKTEELAEALQKTKKYPEELEIFYLDALEVLDEDYEL